MVANQTITPPNLFLASFIIDTNSGFILLYMIVVVLFSIAYIIVVVLSLHQQDIQTYKPLQVKSIISRERMSSTVNLSIVINCTTITHII